MLADSLRRTGCLREAADAVVEGFLADDTFVNQAVKMWMRVVSDVAANLGEDSPQIM